MDINLYNDDIEYLLCTDYGETDIDNDSICSEYDLIKKVIIIDGDQHQSSIDIAREHMDEYHVIVVFQSTLPKRYRGIENIEYIESPIVCKDASDDIIKGIAFLYAERGYTEIIIISSDKGYKVAVAYLKLKKYNIIYIDLYGMMKKFNKLIQIDAKLIDKNDNIYFKIVRTILCTKCNHYYDETKYRQMHEQHCEKNSSARSKLFYKCSMCKKDALLTKNSLYNHIKMTHFIEIFLE